MVVSKSMSNLNSMKKKNLTSSISRYKCKTIAEFPQISICRKSTSPDVQILFQGGLKSNRLSLLNGKEESRPKISNHEIVLGQKEKEKKETNTFIKSSFLTDLPIDETAIPKVHKKTRNYSNNMMSHIVKPI